MNTIHKEVSTIVNTLIAGLVLLACSTVSQANSVYLDPALTAVGIGSETVSLDLMMDFDETTAGGVTRISFDSLFLGFSDFLFGSTTLPGSTTLGTDEAGLPSYIDVQVSNFGGITAGIYTIGTILFDSLQLVASTLVSVGETGVSGEEWSGAFLGPPLASEVSFLGAAVTIESAAIPPVPVPAAVWLFGSGLIGLIGVARRRNSA